MESNGGGTYVKGYVDLQNMRYLGLKRAWFLLRLSITVIANHVQENVSLC